MAAEDRRKLQRTAEKLLDGSPETQADLEELRDNIRDICQEIIDDFKAQRVLIEAPAFKSRWEEEHGYQQEGWELAVESLTEMEFNDRMYLEQGAHAESIEDWLGRHIDAIEEAYAEGTDQ